MATRGQYKLIATVNGERFEKVFYNHWDSYPKVLGNVIVDFIRKVESDKESFLKRLSETKFSYDQRAKYIDGMNILYYLSGETKEDLIEKFKYKAERIESDFDVFEKGEYILCGTADDDDYKYTIDFNKRMLEIEKRDTYYRSIKFDELGEF
jgi:hypothetical protein